MCVLSLKKFISEGHDKYLTNFYCFHNKSLNFLSFFLKSILKDVSEYFAQMIFSALNYNINEEIKLQDVKNAIL